MYGNYAPNTNISEEYYRKIISRIERDPLISFSGLTVAAFVAIIAVTLGGLVWFAKANPGNLIQTSGTVTGISTGKTDAIGTVTTFVTFDFKTREGKELSVRQPSAPGLQYREGQEIRIGYHPRNPNYARNLHDNRPPQISLWLWAVPFVIMIWLIFTALFRYRIRQQEIWDAAEAADSDD